MIQGYPVTIYGHLHIWRCPCIYIYICIHIYIYIPHELPSPPRPVQREKPRLLTGSQAVGVKGLVDAIHHKKPWLCIPNQHLITGQTAQEIDAFLTFLNIFWTTAMKSSDVQDIPISYFQYSIFPIFQYPNIPKFQYDMLDMPNH